MSDALFRAGFRRACATNACPFCTLRVEETGRYLSLLLNEYTLAPDVSTRLARSRGLCRNHAWTLKEIEQAEQQDGLGTATLYDAVLVSLRDDLEACSAIPSPSAVPGFHWLPTTPTPFAAAICKQLRPQGGCLVCEHQKESEDFTWTQFIQELETVGTDGELALLYVGSAGACLPHFLRLLEPPPSDGVARWLTAIQLREVKDQLRNSRLG